MGTWGLSFLDIWVAQFFEQPPMAWVTKLGQAAMNKAQATVKACVTQVKARKVKEAAKLFWDFMKQMWNEDAIGSILREAASKMSWWEWATTGVTMLASFLAQLSSGGAYLI